VLRDALDSALRLALVDDEIELVRLRGNGPGFCSGGDLAEFGVISDVAIAHAIRTTRSIGRLLRQLGDRAEVILHGACIGAGIEFPVFAARVVARPDLTVALPEVSMGLIPGAGGTASLPNRIGRWRTAYLGLTGHRIDADTALAWGLVDAIEPA
jgi:enoyl-CoA hydratase/carnithine racemase